MRTVEQREQHRLEEAARRAADPQRHVAAAARYRVRHPKPRGAGVSGASYRTASEVQRDIERQQKVCRGCGTDKPFAEFHKNTTFPDGLSSKCKPCVLVIAADRRVRQKADPVWVARRREIRLLHVFNLTSEQYDTLYDLQLGRCPGCQRTLAEVKVCVDHDHACCPGSRSCGQCVRGLLCDGCNTALGMVRDDPQSLLRLASYLSITKD